MTASEKNTLIQEVNQMLLLGNEIAATLPQDKRSTVLALTSDIANLALTSLRLHPIYCSCGKELKADAELQMQMCVGCAEQLKCRVCNESFTNPIEILFLANSNNCIGCDKRMSMRN